MSPLRSQARPLFTAFSRKTGSLAKPAGLAFEADLGRLQAAREHLRGRALGAVRRRTVPLRPFYLARLFLIRASGAGLIRGMRFPAALVLSFCAFGCVDGTFEMPPRQPEPLRALGIACDQGSQCETGICGDGVCCDRQCEGTETCHASGSIGTCTARQLGAACTGDAQCPSGFCTDGVCCESACYRDGSRACYSCRVAGSEGRCALAADFTDPRQDCPEACFSCFEGFCVGVPIGTNPDGECPEGQACTAAATCMPGLGASCLEQGISKDAVCASGSCVAGSCSDEATETIDLTPASPAAEHMGISDFRSRDGTAALLFWAHRAAPIATNDLFLAVDAGEGWLVSNVASEPQLAQRQFPAAVAFVGSALYTAQYAPWFGSGWDDCAHPSGHCGLVGQTFTPAGAGSYELIDGQVTVHWIGMANDGAGALYVAYLAVLWEEGSQHLGLFMRKRQGGSWGPRIEITDEPFQPTTGFLGGTLVDLYDPSYDNDEARVGILGLDNGVLVAWGTPDYRLKAWWSDGEQTHTSDAITFPTWPSDTDPCVAYSPLTIAHGSGDEVLFGFTCAWWVSKPFGVRFDLSTGEWAPLPKLDGKWMRALGLRGSTPLFASALRTNDGERTSPGLVWPEGLGWKRTSLSLPANQDIVSFAATAPDASTALVAFVWHSATTSPTPPTLSVARYRF
jgi:hypothetical protein